MTLSAAPSFESGAEVVYFSPDESGIKSAGEWVPCVFVEENQDTVTLRPLDSSENVHLDRPVTILSKTW